MGTLTVTRYPNLNFEHGALFPVAKLNILRTVRSYLAPDTELTHDKALSIFRDIKWKSDIKALLLHPATFFTVSLAAVPYFLIPAVGAIAIAYEVLLYVGLFGLITAVEHLWNGRPFETAYKLQSERLSEYIVKLEENPKMKIKLAPMNPVSKAEMNSRFKWAFAQYVYVTLPAAILTSTIMGNEPTDLMKKLAVVAAVAIPTIALLAYKNMLEVREELR